MKRCLRKVIGQRRLTYDELLTVLTEVEVTLNSRPLTYLTADDLEEPLTPMHLITGRRLLDLRATSEMDPDIMSSNKHANLTAAVKCLSPILEHIWKWWRLEYLTELRDRPRFAGKSNLAHSKELIAVGDIILIHDPDHPRRLGRVERLVNSHDDLVRAACSVTCTLKVRVDKHEATPSVPLSP